MANTDIINNNLSNNIQPRWYIFRVQSGKEDSLITSLKAAFSILAKDGINGNDFFKDFSVPKHHVVKYVNGKKIEKNLNAYPGYIFLNIKMTDAIILFLRNFFRNNGFGQMLPQPITDDEYTRMMDKVNGLSENAKTFTLRIGQRVKINAGSFAAMEGNITAIDDVNKKLEVSVMIFNCETTIEVDYEHVSVIE